MDIDVIFVVAEGLRDESETSKKMLEAYEACTQNKINTTWVKETEINTTELKKTNVIVFDNFEGKEFEAIKEKKSVILGPWCLWICLMESKKIPNGPWPIYNVAMYNCIVTTSHLSKATKMAIREKVQMMGGYYTDILTENATHLITDSVKTAKYMNAVEMNVKLMTPPWVDAVWDRSQHAKIECDNSQFDKFKCPPFHKLVICSTGVSSMQEREHIRQLVSENGGEFTGKLNLKTTDFLICEGLAATSVKYQEARKTGKIHCVSLQWLYDSVKKGYCLPHESYIIRKGTSTPVRNGDLNPNFSTISAINQSKCELTTIDDTMVPKSTAAFFGEPTSGVKRKVFSEYNNLIEQVDIKRVKRSGQFLDGCSIYQIGFKTDEREKLCKIINASGASRCDDMSDRVTHVIVGDPECHELKIIRSKSYSCSIVTLHWLLDSIEAKRSCNEDPYLVNAEVDDSNFRSPLGKKGLNLLRSNRTITHVDLTFTENDEKGQDEVLDIEAEKEIMQRYLVPDVTEEDTLANILKNANFESNQIEARQYSEGTPEDTQSTTAQESQENTLFKGLRFLITGFDEEQVMELCEQINSAMGEVTNNVTEADYVVAPSFISEPLDYDKSITVSDVWLYETIGDVEFMPIEYYHRPLVIKNTAVLEDCVVTLSGYSGFERNFLSSLIQQLGGTSQDQFCRVTSVEKNVMASTHLVTSTASGKKYLAAIKWRLPAVGKDWLMECAKQERKMPEQEFKVLEQSIQEAPNSTNAVNIAARDKENISDNNSKTLTNSKDSATPSSVALASITRGSRSDQNVDEVPSLNEIPPNPQDGEYMIPPLEKNLPEAFENEPAKNINDDSHSIPSPKSSQQFNTLEKSLSQACADDPPKEMNEDSFTIPQPERRKQFNSKTRSLFKTPERRMDEVCSQVTPVDKIMREVRMTDLLGTPESPQLAKAFWDVDTPETPYGSCFDSNPSKSMKKDMLRFLNRFPENPIPNPRRQSTPLSELKKRLWSHIGSRFESKSQDEGNDDNVDVVDQDEHHETEKESNTQTELVNTRLQQLEDLMAAGSGSASKSRRQSKAAPSVPAHVSEMNMRESQPCTVQWDFGKDTQEESYVAPKVFMLSGVSNLDAKFELVGQIEKLGGTVSESSSYDPNATHLLCPKPARNEKTLSSMAAGKWILHTDYIEASMRAGKLLDEEEYEFGNPNSIGKISIELDRDIEMRMQAIHYWRNEIARTGRGPFRDMRAIVVAEKKQALVTVIEAGEGTVIDAKPPFKDVHATHCLIEARSASNFTLYEPLAKQGIYCVNTVYISDFLHRTNKDIKDSILPFYQKYFK